MRMHYKAYDKFQKESGRILEAFKKEKISNQQLIIKNIREKGFLKLALIELNYKVISIILDIDKKAVSLDYLRDAEFLLNLYESNNKLFKLLLKKGLDINFIDQRGYTVLNFAMETGKIKAVKFLLEQGANPNILNRSSGYGVLHVAINRGYLDVVELLLSRNFIKNVNLDLLTSEGLNALYIASFNNNEVILRALLEAGLDPNITCRKGWTALHIASVNSNKRIIELLLSKGVDINSQTVEGFTPFYLACQNNSVDIITYLLSFGANPNIASNELFTPLHLAVESCLIDNVRALLLLDGDRKVNIDFKTNKGVTALYLACQLNQLDIVKALLYAGADPNIYNDDNMCPMDIAIEKGYIDIVKVLLSKDLPKRTEIDRFCLNGITALHIVCIDNNIEVLKELLSAGANPNILCINGFSILHAAVQYGHIDIVKFLLSNDFEVKVDINQLCSEGISALHMACQDNKVEFVKELLSAGADPNKLSRGGFSPLHVAVQYGFIDIVKIFLSNDLKIKADIDQVTKYGCSNLHVASKHNRLEIVKIFLAAGADPNLACDNGYTPLHVSAQLERNEIIDILLSNKFLKRINLDQHAFRGFTALHIAICSKNIYGVKALLRAGADPNLPYENGFTALHEAIELDNIEIFKILLSSDAIKTPDFNMETSQGLTPFLLALNQGNIDFILCMLKRGVAYNKENIFVVVSLSSACQYLKESQYYRVLSVFERALSNVPCSTPLAYSWAGAVIRAGILMEKKEKSNDFTLEF